MRRNDIASALSVALAPIGIAIALLIAAISLSASGWVGAVVYGIAGVLILAGVVVGWMRWPNKEPPATRRPLFMVRLPEPPRVGRIGNDRTIWFEKALITKRAPGDRVLRFELSMPGKEFLDLGDFQRVYQENPSIHSGYHSNPLDLPNNTQAVLAFILVGGDPEVAEAFELSIEDMSSGRTFVVSELGEHTFYDNGSMEHHTLNPPSTAARERVQTRGMEDLEDRLDEIGREERDAYQQVDRDATDRGINRSGIRTSRLVEIAEEHDRVRERAVRDWKRQLEDAGIKDLPEPPPSSAAQPSRFREDETTFDRHWIGRDPLFCGWCGRLAYVASVGGGEAWWCPEHDYEVS